MSSKYSVLWVFLGCCVPAFGQTPVAYEPPQLAEPNAWSIILMPDIQTYSKFGRDQGITELMTAWIAENLQPLRVLTVMQNGNLVEQNGIDTPKGPNGDQTSTQQWTAVSRAFERLDGRTPYILATGNHDYGIVSAENRNTQFPKYFPVDRNPAWKGVLVHVAPTALARKL